jgi:hypothetical protein
MLDARRASLRRRPHRLRHAPPAQRRQAAHRRGAHAQEERRHRASLTFVAIGTIVRASLGTPLREVPDRQVQGAAADAPRVVAAALEELVADYREALRTRSSRDEGDLLLPAEAALKAKGCPFEVVVRADAGPARVGASRIVLQASGQVRSDGPARSQRANPKQKAVCAVGLVVRIFARRRSSRTRSGTTTKRSRGQTFEAVYVAITRHRLAREHAMASGRAALTETSRRPTAGTASSTSSRSPSTPASRT